MASTQAFSVDWNVTVDGEPVDVDVIEATISQRQHEPNSATVQLDTSERPHAIEEEVRIKVTLDDGNDQIAFRGRTDAVRDSKREPLVTVDAREPAGELDDVSAVGRIRESSLWDVLDAIMDTSAGQIRGITFDPAPLKTAYGSFGGSTVFGSFSGYSIPSGLGGPGSPTKDVDFTQQETTGGRGKSAEIQFDYYNNQTGATYTGEFVGRDGDGNTVTATFEIPPGSDAQDAYGTSTFKLPIAGGNGLFAEIDDLTTTLPESSNIVGFGGTVKNYVKTDYNFRIEDNQSVREAIELVVGYISTLDRGRDWEYSVTSPQTGTPELQVMPTEDGDPDRYVFTEGDNVLRPVANRSLDGVYNMVKVNGQNDVNVWAWAFDGTFNYSFVNPFEFNEYPDNPFLGKNFGPTGQVNDIDQIDLRSRTIRAPNADDVFQAASLAEEAVKQLYRTPVSGVAKTAGLHPADPGDEAEVYYPSRGIPAKVVNNIYTVKAVEYTVTPSEATTKVDFGITEPKTGDLIGADSLGGAVRDDLSPGLQSNLGGPGSPGGGGDGQFPVVGTIESENDDGTYDVVGEDGTTYSNVRVI